MRSVFRVVTTSIFSELETADYDDEVELWGSALLVSAFDDIDSFELLNDRTYGRGARVQIEGAWFTIDIAFRGEDWLGFVNEDSGLADLPAARRALSLINTSLRETEGVESVTWADRGSFNRNEEVFSDEPISA